MPKLWESHVGIILKALKDAEISDDATLVVLGSAARNLRTWRSDVDVLLVFKGDKRLDFRPSIELQLHQENREQFLRRLMEGDDYPFWALKLGIAIRDPGGWWAEQAARLSRESLWPAWSLKIEQARRRLKMAKGLLETDDLEASAEELLYAGTQIGRAILLKSREFPLSRPEIPDQLERFDRELAATLRQLIEGGLDRETLARTSWLLVHRLEHLRSEAVGAEPQ